MASTRRLSIILLLIWAGAAQASLLSSLFWWRTRTPEAEPQQTFEEKVGAWLGETMMTSPQRQVRLIVLPGGNLEKCGRAWGAAAKCLSAQTEHLFLLLSPAADSTEARMIIPELEGLHFENGSVPLDAALIEKLKRQNPHTVVSGKMNESGLSRLSQLASVFQVKLCAYRIVPIFLGGRTDAKLAEQLLLPYLKERSSVMVAMLPDGGETPSLQLMKQALENHETSQPSILRIAADLSKTLGLLCHETALTSPPDKRIDTNDPNARILFCQESLDKEPFVQASSSTVNLNLASSRRNLAAVTTRSAAIGCSPGMEVACVNSFSPSQSET